MRSFVMSQSDSPRPFEKKTERLDVRLSHEKKQAFSEACENQGDTPSTAVRRFINSYIAMISVRPYAEQRTVEAFL